MEVQPPLYLALGDKTILGINILGCPQCLDILNFPPTTLFTVRLSIKTLSAQSDKE